MRKKHYSANLFFVAGLQTSLPSLAYYIEAAPLHEMPEAAWNHLDRPWLVDARDDLHQDGVMSPQACQLNHSIFLYHPQDYCRIHLPKMVGAIIFSAAPYHIIS